MTTGDALLRAILETPEDDVARLVYADWLDENGQAERAGFIRKQVSKGEIASFVAGHDSTGWFSAGTHALGEHAYVFVSRGFASRVELACEAFLTNAFELFSRHPIVEVRLVDREPLQFENRWLWHNIDHAMSSADSWEQANSDHLPAWLFSRLEGFIGRAARMTELVKGYTSDYAAMRALADAMPACVVYGRSLAGLTARFLQSQVSKS